ncbi:MAG: hypothetical protein ACYC99_05150 [Candidatus Geothermincolia bacterium]
MKNVDVSILFPNTRPIWQAWFGIMIFPPDAPLRWAKVHLYKWNRGTGTSLAALENFGDRTEAMVMLGWPDRVELARTFEDAGALDLSPSQVTQGDRFSLERVGSECEMKLQLPDGVAASLTFAPGWQINWMRAGGLLTYAGFHSKVKASLSINGRNVEAEGFGILERASGSKLPWDFTRILPINFHWDVAVIDGETLDSSALITIGLGGRKLYRFKGKATLPGEARAAALGGALEYLDMREERNADGEVFAFPERWRSGLRTLSTRFDYVAKSNTPPAAILPGGGMMGFDFEGTVSGSGWAKPVSGYGFTEYGDFSGRQRRLIPR